LIHHTKNKGDLAVAKAIADLIYKEYSVLAPVACEHLPFDLVVYKDAKFYRIQAKYSADGMGELPHPKEGWGFQFQPGLP
jgi:PD-(D/E)XK endonuclease